MCVLVTNCERTDQTRVSNSTKESDPFRKARKEDRQVLSNDFQIAAGQIASSQVNFWGRREKQDARLTCNQQRQLQFQ